MAKGMRSNVKKALRTIRKHEVKESAVHNLREEQKFARLEKAVEQGKMFRQAAEQQRKRQLAENPTAMELEQGANTELPGTGKMELERKITVSLLPRKKVKGKGRGKRRKGKARHKK